MGLNPLPLITVDVVEDCFWWAVLQVDGKEFLRWPYKSRRRARRAAFVFSKRAITYASQNNGHVSPLFVMDIHVPFEGY